MILIDTNIIIDYLKEESSSIDSIQDDFSICGVILAELLYGARTENEKTKIMQLSSLFRWIDIEESLWFEIGNTLNTLKKNGVTVPFQDVIIAALCIQKNLILLTNDKHFKKSRKSTNHSNV